MLAFVELIQTFVTKGRVGHNPSPDGMHYPTTDIMWLLFCELYTFTPGMYNHILAMVHYRLRKCEDAAMLFSGEVLHAATPVHHDARDWGAKSAQISQLAAHLPRAALPRLNLVVARVRFRPRDLDPAHLVRVEQVDLQPLRVGEQRPPLRNGITVVRVGSGHPRRLP